jgi:hypothetical protein
LKIRKITFLTIKKRTCYEDVVVNKPIVFRQFDGRSRAWRQLRTSELIIFC